MINRIFMSVSFGGVIIVWYALFSLTKDVVWLSGSEKDWKKFGVVIEKLGIGMAE